MPQYRRRRRNLYFPGAVFPVGGGGSGGEMEVEKGRRWRVEATVGIGITYAALITLSMSFLALVRCGQV